MHSDARSKVIIVLTDGENNAGNIAPEQAAKFAQTMKVKVTTSKVTMEIVDVYPTLSKNAVQGALRELAHEKESAAV